MTTTGAEYEAIYGSLGRRAGAFAIDYLVVSILVGLAASVSDSVFGSLGRRRVFGEHTYSEGVVLLTWGAVILLAAWSAVVCSRYPNERPLAVRIALAIIRFAAFLVGIAVVLFWILLANRRGAYEWEPVFVVGHIYWIYWAVMESSPTRATVGKMVLGLRVVDLNGRRLSLIRAVGRTFGRLSTAPLFFLIGMPEVQRIPAFNRERGLHDIMAGTLVVRKTTEPVTLAIPRPFRKEPAATLRSDQQTLTTLRLTWWSIPFFLGASILGNTLVEVLVGPGRAGRAGAFVGCLLMSLGLAVKRQERAAAWLLVVAAGVALVGQVLVGSYSGSIFSSLLLGTFIWGAVALQRAPVPVSQNGAWLRTAYELAFFEAVWILMVALKPLSFAGVFNAMIYAALGIALLRRHAWAAYVLVLVTLFDFYDAAKTYNPHLATVMLGFLLVYSLGAIHFRQELRSRRNKRWRWTIFQKLAGRRAGTKRDSRA